MQNSQPLRGLFFEIKKATKLKDKELTVFMNIGRIRYLETKKIIFDNGNIALEQEFKSDDSRKWRRDKQNLTIKEMKNNIESFELFRAYTFVFEFMVDEYEPFTKKDRDSLKLFIKNTRKQVRENIESKNNIISPKNEFQIYNLMSIIDDFITDIKCHDFEDRNYLNNYEGIDKLMLMGKIERIHLYDSNTEEEFAMFILESISEDVIYCAFKTHDSTLEIREFTNLKEVIVYLMENLNLYYDFYHSINLKNDEEDNNYDSMDSIDVKITRLLN